VSAPFQQWALDFIGEIHTPSSGKHKWILTTIDYFTKWIEDVSTRRVTKKVIMNFLEENTLSIFSCTEVIIIDNVASFKSANMIKFCEYYGIELRHSPSYYPQGNGLENHPIRVYLGSLISCWKITRGIEILSINMPCDLTMLAQKDKPEPHLFN
jgi:hypothetical protein